MTFRAPPEILRAALWVSAEPLMVLAAIGAAWSRAAPVGAQEIDPSSWVPLLYLLAVLVASAHVMNVMWVQRLAPIPLSIGLKLTSGLFLVALFMAPIIVFSVGLLVMLLLHAMGAGLGALLGMVGVEAASVKPALGLLFLALVCAVVAAAVTVMIRQIIVTWAAGIALALAELRRVRYGTAVSLAAVVPHLQHFTSAGPWVVFVSAATLGSLALSVGSWLRVGQMAPPRSTAATLALLFLCIGICAATGWAVAWRLL